MAALLVPGQACEPWTPSVGGPGESGGLTRSGYVAIVWRCLGQTYLNTPMCTSEAA